MLRETDDATLLDVDVIPNSRVPGIDDEPSPRGNLRVRVRSPPDKGKANREVITILQEILGPKGVDVTIVSGMTSRHKVVAIRGTDIHSIRGRLPCGNQEGNP